MICLQMLNGAAIKNFKAKEGALTDERLKYVNDMVVGARTIKSYGWEDYFLKKIGEVRRQGSRYVFWIDLLASMGLNFFQNLGILAVGLILFLQWSKGEEIRMAESIALFAMIYYLFITINGLVFLAIINVKSFSAILERIAGVLTLEEYSKV